MGIGKDLKSLTDEQLQQEYEDAKNTVLEGTYKAEIDRRASSEPSGGGFYSAAAATLDEPQGDLLTNFYRNLYNTDEEETYDPGTHMYEWDKFIYPNSPSTDMYHQMAMYNKMENEAPQGKWAKRAYGLYNYPKIIGGSLINDWGQGFLDYGIDQKQGNLTGPLTSYLADQNPIPQGIERLKGANQFIKESWGGERTPEFNEAYNQTVEIPRNIERTAGRVDPSGNVMAYGLNGGGIVKDDYDRESFGGLGGLGTMGQAQLSERFYNPNADREYSKFQVRANEAEERGDIENIYQGLKSWGKNPMFFETITPPPELTEVFSEEEIKDNFNNQLLSIPFDADRTPSFNMEDIEEWMNIPRHEAKIDLQDIFRKYPGIDLWRLIQNLDARGIEYANRGGIIGLL